MKRYTYGQNFTATNSSNISYLVPTGIIEVAPGESVMGKFTVRAISDQTKSLVLNRTYIDLFAFYVPFRLLWDEWTDFIAGKHEGPVPTVGNLQPFLLEQPSVSATACPVWMRRAYNLIWNNYFRTPQTDEVDIDNGQALQAPFRSTTFHQSLHALLDIPETEVDVSGGSLNIDDLRFAFSRDKQEKIRAYYGDKYVDYLNALGVKANWSILEEPELIGVAKKDFPYHTVDLTAEATGYEVGAPVGYFDTTQACKIKTTFAPEHGVIYTCAAVRMELPSLRDTHPIHYKTVTRSFWQPEEEYRKVSEWPGTIIANQSHDDDPDNVKTRKYEDYRKPSTQVGWGGDEQFPYLHTVSEANTPDLKDYPLPAWYDDIFIGNQPQHLMYHNEIRMLKKSPIKPPHRVSGVG